jgi:lysophospholipase L1-like esterase
MLQSLPADAVVLAFGDSLTAGTGAAVEESYPAVLSRMIGRRVINAGVPGEVTEAGLARLPELLEQEKPALVLLCLGGNDFLRRMDDSKAEQNLRDMVQMIRKRDVGVVLIGVPRLGLGLEVPEWYEKIAKDAGIPYEGAVLKRVLSDRSLKSDPIHPNAAGYRQVADALFVLLNKIGALQ